MSSAVLPAAEALGRAGARRLDVRTALAGMLVVNAVALSGGSFVTVLVAAALVLVALATLGRPRLLLGATATLGLCVAAFLLAPRGGVGWGIVATMGFWFTRFGVAALAAAYVVLAVPVGDFVALLARWRVPAQLAVPLTVMLRFLPQLRLELVAVREAMALRGIPIGPSAWALHPLLSVEYLVVPLLVSCSRLADDLTASGLTRGLGGPHRPTPMRVLRFSALDALAALALVGLLVVAFLTRGVVL